MMFAQCFDLLIDHEGNFSADPNDRGNWTGGKVMVGALKGTKFGISAAQYPTLDIRNLTRERAREIYLADYWNKLDMDNLPEWLRYILFDYAVNSGAATAATDLQGALGVLRDGNIGPVTRAAAAKAYPPKVLRLLFVERAMTYALNPNDRLYGAGWFARLFDVTISAHDEIKKMLPPVGT